MTITFFKPNLIATATVTSYGRWVKVFMYNFVIGAGYVSQFYEIKMV